MITGGDNFYVSLVRGKVINAKNRSKLFWQSNDGVLFIAYWQLIDRSKYTVPLVFVYKFNEKVQ